MRMRIQNYIKTVPEYLKIVAVALVATYVGKNIDSWFNCTFILGILCVVWGVNGKLMKGYLHGEGPKLYK